MAPDPSQAPPQLMLTEQSVPAQQPPPEPYYRKIWFWGAVGVVVVTVAVILIAGSGSSGPATPTTTFGNMDAF